MAGISFLKQRRIIFISKNFFESIGVDLREIWYWEFAKFLVMRFFQFSVFTTVSSLHFHSVFKSSISIAAVTLHTIHIYPFHYH